MKHFIKRPGPDRSGVILSNEQGFLGHYYSGSGIVNRIIDDLWAARQICHVEMAEDVLVDVVNMAHHGASFDDQIALINDKLIDSEPFVIMVPSNGWKTQCE
jgi:hypothetical protein